MCNVSFIGSLYKQSFKEIIMTHPLRPETIAVHQGFRGDETNSIVRPIHTSTAYHFNDADHGADIVVHSATKYLGGHGNALGGIIVDGGTFDWTSGKFPSFTEAQEAYHGLVYSEAFGNLAFLIKARAHILRDVGSALSPFNAFLILQGIQTLYIRLDYVSKNALALAEWLEKHPEVEWVSYPLLKSNPDYDRVKEYFPKGAGAILAFSIKGGREKSRTFINSLKLGIHAVNVGDVRTIVTHPASTTHRQAPAAELKNLGISEGFIRISVGLENIEDIKADLDQALGQN
jgi:O-acetylhomoserine (thiol)-lyase